MRNQLSTNSYQQSAVSDLSFPSKREVRFLTSSLSGCLSTYGWLTGQSRIKALDSPIKSENDRKKLYRNDYNLTVSDNSEAGFTLVELMITMAIFLIVIASVSGVFTGLLTQFKQQSKISETNIEGIIGLDMLRRDIEHAGYGLPWTVTGITDTDADGNYWEHLVYTEAASAPASNYNDVGSGKDGPRAILSGNNTGTNNSDYLVIKSANVARNYAAGKNTTLSTGNVKRIWVPDRENVNKDDSGSTNNNVRIIIISPGSSTANSRALVVAAGAFFTTYSNTSAFAPSDNTDTRLIYGIDPDTDLTMPFSRADYYLKQRTCSNSSTVCNSDSDCSSGEVCEPQKCAPNTGILVKTVVNQSGGALTNPLPLLDCVADMQVIYRRDTNADGTIDNTTNDISALTAQQIREQVKEVRVYILAHEGQIDTKYSYPSSTITVGEYGLGSTFNLSSTIGSTYANYRWKVYTLVVKPNNLK